MIRRIALATFALSLAACGSPSSSSSLFDEPPPDASTSDAVTPTDSAVDTARDTSAPGALGAPCTVDKDCASGLCLDIGRCSGACKTAGACPNSTNWTCIVVAGRGPMCVCDPKSTTDVACNGVDDNCDGRIDEGSPLCGGKCVDMKTDPANCGSCGKACGMGQTCVDGACKKKPALDVTLLLDVTGSTAASLDKALPFLKSSLVTPLLANPDVQVGVSYTCDFPVGGYGSGGDRAFTGGVEPTNDSTKVLGAIDAHPKQNGGDQADGMIEALAVLAGVTPHPTDLPLTCSAGRTAGGCFRPEATKVIVLFTDDYFHNGPNPTGAGLLYPYGTDLVPAAADWPATLKAMQTGKILLLVISTASSSTADEQYKAMLGALGQPNSDIYSAGTSGDNADAAAKAVLARLSGLL